MAVAQRDGAKSHGLLRLPGYIETLDSGWVDGFAVPVINSKAAGTITVDACNGFAQVALEAAREPLMEKARDAGIAILAIRNSHHLAALWPDVEPFADAGFIAFSFVNSKSRILIWDAHSKLLGTSPMAFACPRKVGPPLVIDQASGIVAQGEVLLAATEGKQVHEGIGVDSAGRPTTDPNAILNGGAILPFGGHKGSAIALIVEIMAAALTGGQFGFQHDQTGFPAAQTTKAGQSIILIDPRSMSGDDFLERIELLFRAITESGVSRLPGDRRYAARNASGGASIALSADDWKLLETFT
jgi:delta1-piperideine-2-carboxylate reductase